MLVYNVIVRFSFYCFGSLRSFFHIQKLESASSSDLFGNEEDKNEGSDSVKLRFFLMLIRNLVVEILVSRIWLVFPIYF